MSGDWRTLQAMVVADIPWHPESLLRGTLRISTDALVLDATALGAGYVHIPLRQISRTAIETTLRVRPALVVRHSEGGTEAQSRFEFTQEDEQQEGDNSSGLADKVGPGLARDAASKLEGGFRALTGGISQGMRVARHTVDNMARQDDYKLWLTAIAQAQEESRAQRPAPPRSAAPTATTSTPPASIVPDHAVTPRGDVRIVADWFSSTVLSWLTACAARARTLGVRDAPVIQQHYPLDSPICRIVVAGEFSRGKSTVINALFGLHGEIALPTGMTPTTPLACAIRVPRVGETDGASVFYRTSRPALHLTLEAFRTGVRLAEEGAETEGDPPTDLHLDEARRVEVRITGAYLPAGVEIEDTPGLNEAARRSASALAAIGRADLVLFVLAADQLLGDLERDTIERVLLRGHQRNVLFLVNSWESIEEEEQRAVLRQRAETILGGFPTPFSRLSGEEQTSPHIFYISALQAVRAQRQRKPASDSSGISQLRATLRALLGPQSAALLLRARSARALRFVELLRESVSRAAAAAAVVAAGGRVAPEPLSDGALAARTAAIRVLDELPGAIEGATSGRLMSLRGRDTLGMQRAERLLLDGQLVEARRALGIELRAVYGESAATARGAIDLVTAQARAAFLGRGLPAPSLDATLTLAVPRIDDSLEQLELRTVLDGAADVLREALLTAARSLRASLIADLPAPPVQAARAGAQAHANPSQREEDRTRAIALRSLEDDLLRLNQLLTPLLEV